MTSTPLARSATTPLSARQIRRLGRALPRRLTFTREGKLVVFLAFGIGFAAVNSGNNLLYLVFGMLLSFIVLSGVLSELDLRGVRVTRGEAPNLFVGQAGLVPVTLENTKRRMASLSLEVTELFAQDWVDAGTSQRRGFAVHLRPGETTTVWIRVEGGHRGLMASAGLRLATRFPFGFFEKARLFPLPAKYLVFPAVGARAERRPDPRAAGSEEHRGGVGQGDEFHGLRDIRSGDDARQVAWKVSARRDKLIVREHERPATRRILLVLSAAVPPGEEAREDFEAAVDKAATLATRWADEGYAVGLATSEGGFAPETGRAALVRIYEALARLPVRVVAGGLARLPALGRLGDAERVQAERVAVVTPAQQAAGLSVPADRVVVAGSGRRRPARSA